MQSLSSVANVSNLTTCISLNNQPWVTKPALIDLNLGEYNQGVGYYPFVVNLDRSNWSTNTLDDQSSRICIPNRTENVLLSFSIW